MNKKFISRQHGNSFHEKGVEVLIIVLIIASVAAIVYSIYTSL
jgi:Tfp pilus assembly protein PilE